MPQLHSENLDNCQKGIDVLQEVINELNNRKLQDLARLFELNKRWSLEHLETLKEFGRYPHRNKVLGRENTDAEDLYLKDANSFGQQRN
jgi:uncharacterized protein (DUF924 family)